MPKGEVGEGIADMARRRVVTGLIIASAALVAFALWATLVLKLGFSHPEAGAMTALVILSLAQLHIFIARLKDRSHVREEIEGVRAAAEDLRGEVAGLKGDFESMRARLSEKNFLHAEKLAGQVAAMETLIRQLAEEAARREEVEELRLEQVRRDIEEAEAAKAAAAEPVAEPAAEEAPAGKKRKAAKPKQSAIEEIRRSLESNRIDLYLQPIVTLPQRKVRYYEAFSRLRDDAGGIVMPASYLTVAEESGLMPMLDNLLLFRSVGVVRKLLGRKRETGVFCNISTRSLLDEEFFSQFIDFMEMNAELSDAIVFEFAQGTYGELGPIEIESLQALAGHGFRFSLDHVETLDIDFQALHAVGFRYLKVNAQMILSDVAAGNPHIHPNDLGALAGRYGLELIAEKIENEHQAVNLLDCDVKYGQGYLFARPRLVRENASDSSFPAAA